MAGRYYTAQIMDEWADVLCNVNERTFPARPHGRFALCLKGSSPTLPEGAQRTGSFRALSGPGGPWTRVAGRD